MFCIEKDTRIGVLYAPFACVLMTLYTEFAQSKSCTKNGFLSHFSYLFIIPHNMRFYNTEIAQF